jgi:anti-anti-sigma factor
MEFHPHGTHPDVLVVVADRELDSYDSLDFVTDLMRTVEAGVRGAVVDCSRLGHVSTITVCTLVRLHKRLALHGGMLHLAAVQPPLRRVLGMTRLDTVFRLCESLDEAVEMAAAGQAPRA